MSENFFILSISLFLPAVPAQPSNFEAETELDSRIMLSWLWPVQDPIISFELLYWEADDPKVKVNISLKTPLSKSFLIWPNQV